MTSKTLNFGSRDVEAPTGAAGVLAELGGYQDSKHLHVHVHSGPCQEGQA